MKITASMLLRVLSCSRDPSEYTFVVSFSVTSNLMWPSQNRVKEPPFKTHFKFLINFHFLGSPSLIYVQSCHHKGLRRERETRRLEGEGNAQLPIKKTRTDVLK